MTSRKMINYCNILALLLLHAIAASSADDNGSADSNLQQLKELWKLRGISSTSRTQYDALHHSSAANHQAEWLWQMEVGNRREVRGFMTWVKKVQEEARQSSESTSNIWLNSDSILEPGIGDNSLYVNEADEEEEEKEYDEHQGTTSNMTSKSYSTSSSSSSSSSNINVVNSKVYNHNDEMLQLRLPSDNIIDMDGNDDSMRPYSTLLMRTETILTVGHKNGSADFHSVQDAVDAVPKGNKQRVIIKIAAGVYKEKVKIPSTKSFITLLGEGMDNTKITWHDTASSSKTTFKSATVSVMSRGFVAKNLAFENTAPAPPPGAQGAQAVAFQISGDKAALYSCAFYGAQDTLYDHKGRHYFHDCVIEGSIDFIFGDGQSLYEGCELRTLKISTGSLTAQKRRTRGERTGFAFLNCTVTGEGKVYLGRAWGAYSRVIFLRSYLGVEVLPGGWNDWGIPARDKTAFYGEYDCTGPGANAHNRVSWSHQLTAEEAMPFMSLAFIDGRSWIGAIS